MALHDRDYMQASRHNRWVLPGWPDAVTTIVAANVIVFLLQRVFGLMVDSQGQAWGALSIQSLLEGRVWTLFTHMFVHRSLLHVLCNCLMIFFTGRALQSLLGPRHFLYVFFLSGLFGAVVELLAGWLASDMHPMIGASAAAFGTFLALATILPEEMITAMIYFIIPVRMRLWSMAMLFTGISVVLAILQATGVWVSNIAHYAHLGGALAGWWFVRLLGYGGPPVTYEHMWHERQRREEARAVVGAARRSRVTRRGPESEAVTPLSKRQFIEQEIDPILDKIAEHGIQSLSEEERGLLEKARTEILRHER